MSAVQIELADAEGAMLVEFPDDAMVVSPADPPVVVDPERTIREAVRPWLRGLRSPGVLVLSDLLFDQSIVLPALLSELARVGLRSGSLSIVCGPRVALDTDVTDRYDVRVHDATDIDEHISVGEVADTPVLLDRGYVEATSRLTLGVVQPHHACGFTGGAETVCPGISAQPTLDAVRALADDPGARWLQMRGNPVHDFIRGAVKLAPPRVSLDLAVDASGAPTGAWCGPLPHGHQAACAFVEQNAVRLVAAYADVVVTAGEPLEAALATAHQVVRPGGTVIAVTTRTEIPTSWDSAAARIREPVLVRPHLVSDVASVVASLLPATIVVLPRAPQTVTGLLDPA